MPGHDAGNGPAMVGTRPISDRQRQDYREKPMSDPYLGQIIAVGFDFAPAGWELCQGQLMSIAQNPALYQLLGTTYGGDGQNTFALPDLRGRVAISRGQ